MSRFDLNPSDVAEAFVAYLALVLACEELESSVGIPAHDWYRYLINRAGQKFFEVSSPEELVSFVNEIFKED